MLSVLTGFDSQQSGSNSRTSRRSEPVRRGRTLAVVSAEDLERYETEIELQLYREYRDVLPMFQYVVETERRFYLANDVKLDVKVENGRTYFDLQLRDAWVWDMYRPTRFVADVHVVTFKDVNVEELPGKEL
jgi:Protein of unknown function (DUF2469)